MPPTLYKRIASVAGSNSRNNFYPEEEEYPETPRKRQSESLLQNFYFRNPHSNIGPRKGSNENDSKTSSTILGSFFGSDDSSSASSYDSVGSFSGGGCGCGCGCGNDGLLPLLALAALIMFLMMQGGGGRRKRSTSEDGLLMNITHEVGPPKRISWPSNIFENVNQEARLFKEENDSKGSFSGHGGYDEGCTYCAKVVWIGVAALAIQAFMMQQGGGKKKRKRRNTIDIIDLNVMKYLNQDIISDTFTKPIDVVSEVVGNSHGSLVKPIKMYSGKFKQSISSIL